MPRAGTQLPYPSRPASKFLRVKPQLASVVKEALRVPSGCIRSTGPDIPVLLICGDARLTPRS